MTWHSEGVTSPARSGLRFSLRTQIVGSTVLLAAAVMIVLTAGTQIVLSETAHREIVNSLKSRADVAVDALQHSSTVDGAQLDPGARVYDESGMYLGGAMTQQSVSAADKLAAAVLNDHAAHDDYSPDDFNLRAVPFTSKTGLHGVVVVSRSTSAYSDSQRDALLVTTLLGVIVIGLAGAVALRVTRAALQPVRLMAERAAEWSERDLARRFDLGPPSNELAALGETLDHLLDRVAAALRSEQRLTSELAHELRTPLTAIRGSAELALMRPNAEGDLHDDLQEIATAARRMEGVVAMLLELARTPEAKRSQETAEVAEVFDRVTPLANQSLALEIDIDDSVPTVGAPVDLVVRALSPLVENAVHHAKSQVGLHASATSAGVEIRVTDDGDGVDDNLRGRIFEAGISGRGGTGLGLGIAGRVARSLGGDVILRDAERTEFVLVLPRG